MKFWEKNDEIKMFQKLYISTNHMTVWSLQNGERGAPPTQPNTWK